MVGFREILRRLTDAQVDFFVIGGVAASLHGSPVVTLDVDVCTHFDQPNLDKMIMALGPMNPRLRMRPDKMRLPLEPARLEHLKNLYLLTDFGVFDLLGEVPEIGTFDQVIGKTIVTDVGGFSCRILDLDTLIASKQAAGREKDKFALVHLYAIRTALKQQPGLFSEPKVPNES